MITRPMVTVDEFGLRMNVPCQRAAGFVKGDRLQVTWSEEEVRIFKSRDDSGWRMNVKGKIRPTAALSDMGCNLGWMSGKRSASVLLKMDDMVVVVKRDDNNSGDVPCWKEKKKKKKQERGIRRDWWLK